MYNCCINFFGSPEYPSLKQRNLEPERVYDLTVIASEAEIQENYILVDERSNIILPSDRRRADDESYLNEDCKAYGILIGVIYP
jgi:hypothetical protein